MKKKVIAVLLTAAMAVGMTACGSADSGSASDSSAEKGCASAVVTLPAMISLLGFAVVYTLGKKKQA